MTDQSRPVATGYPAPHSGATAASNGYPPGATGYPYSGPPPPQSTYYYNNHNPNAYYDAYNRDARRAAFFRRLLAGVFASIISFGAILFIMWLVIRPRIPHFRLDSLSVSQLNVSSSPSAISGVWEAKFTVFNTNSKLHVYYDKFEGDVFYRNAFLAQNQLPPFDQGTKSQTNITAKLVASGAYVEDWVVSGITDDKSKGSVNFNVKAEAVVHFKTGIWRARRRWLRVSCDNLVVGIASNSSNGAMTGGSKSCNVDI